MRRELCNSDMASVAILVSALLLLLLSPTAAELQRVQHAPKEDESLTVLAVGDWGRGGQYNQTLVAEQV
jgi:tartrate-resistant acid phosphatase type 5